jgi:subtilisin family serine protease
MLAVLCLAAAIVGNVTIAQQSEATFPVLVVFRDDVPFDSFLGSYHVDERFLENPAAWNYLDPGVVGAVQALEASEGFRAHHVYSAALPGFAARLTARQIDSLKTNLIVTFVEDDGVMSTDGFQNGNGQILPWGIDRIDADLSSTRAGDGSGAVTNVHAYIIDTGIDVAQEDLNVINHVNFAGDGINTDCHGHGTHVAGTVAASDNTIDVVGVAPGAPLTGVKVLGCFGSGASSDVVKGVDWVTKNAVQPAIANMSLGGGANRTLDRAVKRSANRGIFYSIAAGNSGLDACGVSPAAAGSAAGVMTTAATDNHDIEPSWSNFGPCVDIWAPGVSIISTRLGGGTTTFSGTSMAAPHVGGTAALYLSSHPAASPADVELALKNDRASTGTVSKDGRPIACVYAGLY